MSISPKVMQAVKLAKEAVLCGKCAVISFQTTEGLPLEPTETILPDFLSTRTILETLVMKHFPESQRHSADGSVTAMTGNTDEIINLVSDEDENGKNGKM